MLGELYSWAEPDEQWLLSLVEGEGEAGQGI